MTLRIVQSPVCEQHNMGPEHPESPERIQAINDALLFSGLDMICERVDATPISRQQLEQSHDVNYIDSLFAKQPVNGLTWLDDDTAMGENTLEAAMMAAGACCDAVDWVMAGKDRQAFCLVRPPGHHALYDQAMGFCLFNNIVLAARHAIKQYGITRIAIVDFDVHHGNGTENMVAGDPHIHLYSSFQYPFYPNSGVPPSADNITSTLLDAGSSGNEFREAVTPWFAHISAFSPELILVSAGFDGHANDPMAYLRLNEEDYYWISDKLRSLATDCCDGRIVSTLEGGYDLPSLARSVVSHLRGLTGTG